MKKHDHLPGGSVIDLFSLTRTECSLPTGNGWLAGRNCCLLVDEFGVDSREKAR